MRRKTTEIEKLAAAYLAGEKGKNQAEIGKLLGISQTVVSRLLSETKNVHWREHTEFLQGDLNEAIMQTVRQRVGTNKLEKAIAKEVSRRSGGKKRGPVLKVFPGGSKKATDWERTAEFGRQAAPYVHELLLRSRSCGLTWGSRLWRLINALQHDPMKNRPAHKIECVPLSGEPLGNSPVAFSSSSLAAELGRIVNGDDYHALSIAMVPAFIPEDFSAAERRGVRRLIELVRSYKEIFGSRGSSRSGAGKGLVDDLDMILTSVGPKERVLGFGAGRLFEAGKVTIEQLQQLVIGDMGGVCFPRPGLDERGQRLLKGVEDRWTGLTRAHLERCAAAAQADPVKPGVVVVSAHKDRAPFIHHALDLINNLIVDEDLAVALEQVMGV